MHVHLKTVIHERFEFGTENSAVQGVFARDVLDQLAGVPPSLVSGARVLHVGRESTARKLVSGMYISREQTKCAQRGEI